ncbi:hypothetical protein A4R43_09395 [Amycolatopsis albispora]|uniref:Uncharacterized protein n=1 Tax=Amycolatopsis albispora TaxID=1804986 RepID=A0A344L3U3_9PSEU|nr:hypothetical protein A4R43_09395 [Amycolatopsis albispora]
MDAVAQGGDPGSWPGLGARLAGDLLTRRDCAVEAAVASLGLRPGARALDVGTGPGACRGADVAPGSYDVIWASDVVLPVALTSGRRP